MADFDNLNLSDDEEEVLAFENSPTDEVQADPTLCLVGNFLTHKPIKYHIMKDKMAFLWQPGRKVAIKGVQE
jgi:hypothetical protein